MQPLGALKYLVFLLKFAFMPLPALLSPQSYARAITNFLPEAARGVHIAHGGADWLVGSDRRAFPFFSLS